MLCIFVKNWKMSEYKHGEGDDMQTSQGFGQSFVVSRQPAEAVELSKAAFNHPAARQQNEALFHLRQSDDLKLDAFVEYILRRFLAGVSLIGERHLDRASGLLNLTRQFPDLCALLLVGRPHIHGKQLPQGTKRHMYLAAAFAFVAVVTSARPTLAGRLQRASVENDRAGLTTAPLRDPHNRTQVIDHDVDAACLNPAQRVEHLAQFVATLWCVLVQQCQVRSGEVPRFIRYIRWVGSASFHPARLPGPAENS